MVLLVSEVVWSSPHWAAAATGQRRVCDCGCAVWWNVVGISLFEVCWWLHQTGVKKTQKKKNQNKTHTHKKTKHTKHTKKLPIFYSVSNFTSLFLIIKPENCVFLSFFPRPVCWLLFNIKSVLLFLFCFVLFLSFFCCFFFLTRRGRARGWGERKGP